MDQEILNQLVEVTRELSELNDRIDYCFFFFLVFIGMYVFRLMVLGKNQRELW